jgi:hypothetical protein
MSGAAFHSAAGWHLDPLRRSCLGELPIDYIFPRLQFRRGAFGRSRVHAFRKSGNAPQPPRWTQRKQNADPGKRGESEPSGVSVDEQPLWQCLERGAGG